MNTNKNDNTPARYTHDDPLFVLIMQKYVLDWAYAQHSDLKDEVMADFTEGMKHTVKNAQGVELGSITMSNPNSKAIVDDLATVLGEAHEKGMELLDSLPSGDDPRAMEIIEILHKAGRTDLLDTTISKDDEKELAENALEQWQITGTAPLGWKIVKASKPTFSVKKVTGKKASTAQKAVEHLYPHMKTALMIEAPAAAGEKK